MIVYAVMTGEYENTRTVENLYTNKPVAEEAIKAYKEVDKIRHEEYLKRAEERYERTGLERHNPYRYGDNNYEDDPKEYWIEELEVRDSHE